MTLTREEIIALIKTLRMTYVVQEYQRIIYDLVQRMEEEVARDGKET